MRHSKTWTFALVVFVVSIVFVILGKLTGGEWVTLVLGKLMALIGRDTIKDDNSALNHYIEGKRESIQNDSDDDLASRVDRVVTKRHKTR